MSSSPLATGAAPAWIVLKFGGTSVSRRDRWDTIGALMKRRAREEGTNVLVVVSALSGVTFSRCRDDHPGLEDTPPARETEPITRRRMRNRREPRLARPTETPESRAGGELSESGEVGATT